MELYGQYQLIEKIGAGGMAEVYRARPSAPGALRRDVALKRIRPSLAEIPEFVEMFMNEARIAAQLDHPNIVHTLELGQAQGTPFLALEFVEGASFDAILKEAFDRHEYLPLGAVLRVVATACEALDYAHRLRDEQGNELGLVHRDVSPDNLLLARNGALKLADFGIAKVASLPKLTKTGIFKGKVNFAAPEHLRGKKIDRRADVFALGVVLYQALTGLRPFERTTPAATMQAVVREPMPSPLELRPDLPEDFIPVLERALSKDPEDRYPDARSFMADLQRLLSEHAPDVTLADLAGLVETFGPVRTGPKYTPPPASLSSAYSTGPTDETYVRPSAPTTVERPKVAAPTEVRPAVAAKAKPAWAAPAPATLEGETLVRPRTGPKAPSDFTVPERSASQASDEHLGVMPTSLLPGRDPREVAVERAFALADEKIKPEDEKERSPGRVKGEKFRVPTSMIIVGMVLLGIIALTAVKLVPKSAKVVAGAKIAELPTKTLTITANVGTADVFLNDTFLGRTPLEMENNFPFGQRTPLTIRAVGFEPVEAVVVGGRGQKVDVTFLPPSEDE